MNLRSLEYIVKSIPVSSDCHFVPVDSQAHLYMVTLRDFQNLILT